MSSASAQGNYPSPTKLMKCGGSAAVIGLDVIRHETGSRWEKMREAIFSRLEVALRQRLGPSDFFIPIDDVSLLVVMPTVTPEEAQMCCLRIAYELHISLLGPCTIEQLRIASAVATADDTLEITPISAPHMATLAKRAGLSELIASKGAGKPAMLPASQASPLTIITEPEVPLCHFMPIWDAQNGAITAYRCTPKQTRLMYSMEVSDIPAPELLQLSLTALDRAVGALEVHLAHGMRVLVNILVPYEVLATPVARMEFVAACRQLRGELRPYLVIEIVGLPVGVPPSRLADLVSTVQSFGRAVFARVPLNGPSLSACEGSGLKGIGFRIVPGPGGVSDMKNDIERLCTAAKRLRLPVFLDDVPTNEMVRFAHSAGVQWMSGAVISQPIAELGPMVRLGAETFVHNRGAARAVC
ncbi:MAG: hypothetical protein WCA81_10685 [Rhizomicrobium sp.]